MVWGIRRWAWRVYRVVFPRESPAGAVVDCDVGTDRAPWETSLSGGPLSGRPPGKTDLAQSGLAVA